MRAVTAVLVLARGIAAVIVPGCKQPTDADLVLYLDHNCRVYDPDPLVDAVLPGWDTLRIQGGGQCHKVDNFYASSGIAKAGHWCSVYSNEYCQATTNDPILIGDSGVNDLSKWVRSVSCKDPGYW